MKFSTRTYPTTVSLFVGILFLLAQVSHANCSLFLAEKEYKGIVKENYKNEPKYSNEDKDDPAAILNETDDKNVVTIICNCDYEPSGGISSIACSNVTL